MTPTTGDGILEGPNPKEVSMEDTRWKDLVDGAAAQHLAINSERGVGQQLLAEQIRIGYQANKDLYNARQAEAHNRLVGSPWSGGQPNAINPNG